MSLLEMRTIYGTKLVYVTIFAMLKIYRKHVRLVPINIKLGRLDVCRFVTSTLTIVDLKVVLRQ